MSLNIKTSPAVDPDTVRALLTANLLSVFNERDDAARIIAVRNTYAEDIVWYEPDRVIQGHDGLNRRAAELLNQSPGFVFKPDGDMVVSQNLGILHWKFGPQDQPDLIKGVDAILIQGDRIAALWTALTKVPA